MTAIPFDGLVTIVDAANLAAPVFEANDWRYWGDNGHATRDELAETIRSLVTYLLEDPDAAWIGSGRFTVMRHLEEGMTCYQLMLDLGEFCVEEEEA